MEINWSGYRWWTNERWGLTHPLKPKWWYDEDAVMIDSKNILHLFTRHNPKTFPGVNPQVGAGLVSCRTKFKHGTFEINAMLPTGKHLWPAFWMYSWEDMTPEIDVFEAYTNTDSSYWRWNLFNPWKVETNLFYTDNNTVKSIGNSTHSWGFTNPRTNYIKYKLIWRPDIIQYVYNGKTVREIKDKKILDKCNATTMNVIINNGVDDDCKESPSSDFKIKYFTYTPLTK